MSREELEARFGSSQAVTDARINALLERMDAAVAHSTVQYDNLVEAIRDIRIEMRDFRIEVRADMDERFRQFVEAGARQHEDFRAQMSEWRVQNDKMIAALRAEWQWVARELRAEGQQHVRDLDRSLVAFRASVRNYCITTLVTVISAAIATIFGVASVVGNTVSAFESGSNLALSQADLKRQIADADTNLKRQIAETDTNLKHQIAETDANLKRQIAENGRQIAEMHIMLQRRLPPSPRIPRK